MKLLLALALGAFGGLLLARAAVRARLTEPERFAWRDLERVDSV